MHTTTLEPGSVWSPGARSGAPGGKSVPKPAFSAHSAGIPAARPAGAPSPHQKNGRRARRFGLLSTLQQITTLPRTAACGWRRIEKGTAPAVVLADGVAHIAGTQRCGAVWQCPVCGPKIRHGRAVELDNVLVRWLALQPAGTVQLWTLTQPHTSGEALHELRSTIKAAWRAVTSGRGWQVLRSRHGFAHMVTALDVTHGPNGWHPHLHVIMLTTQPAGDDALAEIRAYVLQQWDRALVARGRAKPHPVHGVQIERARSRADVGNYICQVIGETDDDAHAWGVAQEAARTDLKTSPHPGHRTPWQILEAIRARRARSAPWDDTDDANDEKDLALWREYETGMKGARAISFSRGLRAAVGVEAEQTDEELAAAEIGGTVLCSIDSRKDWLAVRITRGGMVRLLRVAESHGERGVLRIVRTMRHRKRNDPRLLREIETTTFKADKWKREST